MKHEHPPDNNARIFQPTREDKSLNIYIALVYSRPSPVKYILQNIY